MDKIQTNVSQSIEQKPVEKKESEPIQEKPVYVAVEPTAAETVKPKMSIEEKTNILNQLKSRELSDAARNALIKMLSE